MKSLQGQFLVAAPKLVDPNFYQSVVLMIEHNKEGALGVILNRPTNKPVRDVWKMVFDDECNSEECLYLGGPVQGPLMAIHGDPLSSETEILPGLFLATQRELIHRLVTKKKRCRIFTGCAGWGPGQLEDEFQAGGWLATPATVKQVFEEPDKLWDETTRAINLDILLPRQHQKHLPEDPTVN